MKSDEKPRICKKVDSMNPQILLGCLWKGSFRRSCIDQVKRRETALTCTEINASTQTTTNLITGKAGNMLRTGRITSRARHLTGHGRVLLFSPRRINAFSRCSTWILTLRTNFQQIYVLTSALRALIDEVTGFISWRDWLSHRKKASIKSMLNRSV